MSNITAIRDSLTTEFIQFYLKHYTIRLPEFETAMTTVHAALGKDCGSVFDEYFKVPTLYEVLDTSIEGFENYRDFFFDPKNREVIQKLMFPIPPTTLLAGHSALSFVYGIPNVTPTKFFAMLLRAHTVDMARVLEKQMRCTNERAGVIVTMRLPEFMAEYPEYAEEIKLGQRPIVRTRLIHQTECKFATLGHDSFVKSVVKATDCGRGMESTVVDGFCSLTIKKVTEDHNVPMDVFESARIVYDYEV